MIRKHIPKACHERKKFWKGLVERGEEEGVRDERGRGESLCQQRERKEEMKNEIFWANHK
jgi:hypothetical protein